LLVAVGAAVCWLPAWQTVKAEHFRSDVAVAGLASYSVAVQTVRARHWPLLSYLPTPHVEQIRSEVALGATLWLSPVLHVDQGAQVAALSVLLKVEAAQGLHLRSLAFVGLAFT
jgi:hypothetical protein